MIERDIDTYTLTCDECGDDIVDFDTFDEAVEFKKSHGWKSRKDGNEYSDICPMCHDAQIKTGEKGIIEDGSIANTLVENVVNEKIYNTTKCTINSVLKVFKAEDLRDEMATQILKIDNLFYQNMTKEEKKEHLLESLPEAINDAFMLYFNKRRLEFDSSSLKNDLRRSYRMIIDETLQAIADETKRGSLIPCTAVVADAKGDECTKATVQYPRTYKMTIPSYVLIISSDVVQLIQDSVPSAESLDKIEDVEPVPA